MLFRSGRPHDEIASYGLAKLALLQGLRAFRAQHGLRSVYPLLVNLYGPGDNIDDETRYHAAGALLKDGSTVPADLLVLATGYYPQKELVRRALGEAMAERIGPVWGLGEDGELSNMYKRTPQQGLWFIAGGLAQCRINSKYLALQIKAMELGKLGPL